MKAKEPASGYLTTSMIDALRSRVVECIQQEKDIDKLNQCIHILSGKQSRSSSRYDEADFIQQEADHAYLKGASMPCQFTDEEMMEEIKASERSGTADPEEVNAFFARWKHLG